MNRLLLTACLLLAACATPQERCIAQASRDARVIDRLIAETEGNIARGYAFETEIVMRPDFVDCTPPATEENPDPATQRCLVDVPTEMRQPVAIDLAAEERKLQSLRERQAAIAAGMEDEIARCQALHPEA